MEILPLPDSTILVVEVGSTAHGTGLPGGEDLDLTAVVVESAEEVLGLAPGGPATIMQRTQPEGVRSGPGDIDRTVHPLRRFLYLAASGNPSVLMSLWAPVIEATAEGLELQGMGEYFVGRHVIPGIGATCSHRRPDFWASAVAAMVEEGVVSETSSSANTATTPSTPCTVRDLDFRVWSCSGPDT